MNQNPTPYDGTRIFKPIPPLRVVVAEAIAMRADKTDKMAEFYAKPEVYEQYYKDALKRLAGGDMLTLAKAAKRVNLTPEDYKAKAEKGEAVLITLGRRHFVPAWTITKDGQIDALKTDIAREFAREGDSYHKFLDYFKFMTEEKVDIAPAIEHATLSMMFHKAGLKDFDCKLSVGATMNQLADLREIDPFYHEALILHLDKAVTHGGWDPSGGISREFRNKYNITGQSIDEQRSAPRP